MDKICRICHQQKPLSEFYNDANNRDGLTTLCKDCTKEASRQYEDKGVALRTELPNTLPQVNVDPPMCHNGVGHNRVGAGKTAVSRNIEPIINTQS